jgi:hypothetical protein
MVETLSALKRKVLDTFHPGPHFPAVTQPLRHDEPPALHDRALQDLSYIRRTMEGASAFTDVSGRALVVIGGVALVVAFLADRQPTLERWLTLWIAAAIFGSAFSLAMMHRKMAQRQGRGPSLSVPARKFLLAFWPSVAAGAVITAAIVGRLGAGYALIDRAAATSLLAGVWLLLFGVGVMAAGAFSVRAVPLMGGVFLGLGVLALVVPGVSADLWLAAGFGLAQIVAGVHIIRSHGG